MSDTMKQCVDHQEDILIKQCADHQKEMVAFLERMVNIDSKVDHVEGIRQVAEIIGGKLETLGFDVRYLDGGELPTHVLATKKSDNPKAKNILITGHMDTVFNKGTAAKRPFTIRGEKAYGPGVVDMKSGITIALHALQVLYETGWDGHNVTVLFAGDEEPGHPKTNFKEKMMEIAKGHDAAFNFETGVDNGNVVVARRGVMYPVVTVEGISAHSGKDPEKGANAIRELAYKIGRLYELDDKERGINFNAGVIRGGIVANGVAGHAELEADFRFDRAEDQPYIREKLQEVAKEVHVPRTVTTVAIEESRTFLPMEIVPGTEELFSVVKAQAEKVGFRIDKIIVGSGSDSCWTTYVGVPTICAMGGRGGLNHSEQEYLFIESLTDKSQIFALTLRNL